MERARVSQVIDYFAEPYLVAWKLKNKDHQKVSEEALRVGTIVDTAVQYMINNPNCTAGGILADDRPVINALTAWQKFTVDRPDVLERLIKYRHNMQRELILGDLVGHPDFILDDEVIDLKTSKRISKSHWMQTAQYATMWDKMNLDAWQEANRCGIKRISILRLDKETGDYEYRTLGEPFITFWQKKFQCRYEAFREDYEFNQMMQGKLEEEKLA